MIYFVDTSSDYGDNTRLRSIIEYIKDNMDDYYLLNFMSQLSIGDKLNSLEPKYDLAVDFAESKEEEFERKYFDYLLYDKDAFLDIMEIMMSEYYGGNVIVLTDLSSNIISDAIEIIRSFIYKRYGENPVIIRDIIDILECDTQDRGMDQSAYDTFLRDKEYYIMQVSDPDKLIKNSYEVEKVNGGMV